jgi:hypothetical protein
MAAPENTGPHGRRSSAERRNLTSEKEIYFQIVLERARPLAPLQQLLATQSLNSTDSHASAGRCYRHSTTERKNVGQGKGYFFATPHTIFETLYGDIRDHKMFA